MIRLRFLGPIDIRDADGTEVRAVLAQPKRVAVLAYLATASPIGPKRRDTLLGIFWPELDQDHARNALSKALHFLRRALGDEAIISRNADEVELGAGSVWTDVNAFSEALDERRIEDGLQLYRGDLLQSFFVPEARGFEEWLERERARLRGRAAGAARALAEQHEQKQHLTQAIECARRAVDLSDGDERPLRRLLELFERVGDRAGAIRAYESFARKLAAELETEPSPETAEIINRLKQSPRTYPVVAAAAVASPTPPEPSGSALERLATSLAGRYKVERQLGAGAMAVVALAHDVRHHRRVAIKVLRPELSSIMGAERFLREIDIVASLMHPHILPLHDSGESGGLLYYVMPYVDGGSLRGRLEREGSLAVEEALQLGREIADALAYAHHHGFVHRDIKPENILLGGGHALVADFGIARAIGSAGADQLAIKSFATGTPAYMSPEQLTGDSPVNERSDIYALGCVVYEMLSGEAPFAGSTPEAAMNLRLAGPPPHVSLKSAEVSPMLDQAIAKALATRPSDRFSNATEFASALKMPAQLPRKAASRSSAVLKWLQVASAAALVLGGTWGARQLQHRREAASTLVENRTIAVLPLRNLGDSSDAYLVEGMTQELNGALIRTGEFAVRPRTIVAAAAASGRDLEETAARLGARYVLDGSADHVGTRFRLAVELVQVDGSVAMWSRTYEVADDAVSTLPESLVTQIATVLSIPLKPTVVAAIAASRHRDPVAYDLYLQARHFSDLQTVGDVERSAALFTRAIAQDSNFAQAWVGLAAAYDWLSQLGGQRSADIQALWRTAADRAVSLDSLNADAYVQRANLRSRYEWDFTGSGQDLRRAITLSPSSGDALLNYAQFLNVIGLHDSALAVMRHAVAINPTVAFRVVNLVPRLRMVGRLDEAAAEARRALALDSTLWIAHLMLAAVAEDQDHRTIAAAEAERAHAMAGDLPFVLGTVARYYGRAGQQAAAMTALVRLTELARRQYVQQVFLAEARLGVGDRAGALNGLEESARIRESDLTWKLAYGHFRELEGEPRFDALVARVGLPGMATQHAGRRSEAR
jgi:eukaryotic-like serine/threonine-protein kinase